MLSLEFHPCLQFLGLDVLICSSFAPQKLIQYAIRVGLIFHLRLISTRLLRRLQRPAWETSIVRRLTETASGLSTTRRVLWKQGRRRPVITPQLVHRSMLIIISVNL